jgi:hypothetical protein
MAWTYAAYGLRLRADGAIPGLAAGDPSKPPDLHIYLRAMPDEATSGERLRWFESQQANRHGRPNLVIWRAVASGALHFMYDDGAEFLLAPDGRTVWCTWSAAATTEDAMVYLRGPILAMVLRLRGVVCLHAASVSTGSRAIALLGSAGAGKSTTAAALVTRGFRLLADDVSALRFDGADVVVLPGPTRLGLWPDAGAVLFGHGRDLPRVTPAGGINDWWDKRYVEADDVRPSQRTPLPLAAIYVLAARTPDADAPRVRPMSLSEAFLTLTEDTYINYAIDERMRAEEFLVLGRVVRAVPIRWVNPSADPARLDALCDIILEDFETLTGAVPASE